jgi:glycosyltransferase involved in cell wall biosynthesis
MKLTVIIPVHNGGANFARCLRALMRSQTRPDEVIVVDDASADASAEVARSRGAQVVRVPPPSRGPAFARNRGAEIAQGEVLFFTDADVLLHPDALGLALETLQGDATIDACFGSYDDVPEAGGLVSQYKNLLHHYVHQHGAESAGTFWTACGAIRKTAFQEAGGFDEDHKKPSIEDVELGSRLRCQGKKIRLVKAMQATHLKRWTMRQLLSSDILQRAVPWSRLLLAEPRAPKDLNLNASARWSAAALLAFILTCIAGFFFPLFFLAAFALAAALFLLNFDLYRFLKRKRGWFFVVRVIPLHWLYFFYSAVTFATVVTVAIPSLVFRRGTRANHRKLSGVTRSSETSGTE